MGWASMYHVKKIYYLCLLFRHVTIINILTYIQLSTHAGEEAIKYQIKQL